MSQQGDDIQIVVFRVGGQEFAFNVFHVQRILRYEAPAPLPKAPAFLEGVLQIQGAVVPVIDLRKRFELRDAPQREETRTMVLECDGLVVACAGCCLYCWRSHRRLRARATARASAICPTAPTNSSRRSRASTPPPARRAVTVS